MGIVFPAESDWNSLTHFVYEDCIDSSMAKQYPSNTYAYDSVPLSNVIPYLSQTKATQVLQKHTVIDTSLRQLKLVTPRNM